MYNTPYSNDNTPYSNDNFGFRLEWGIDSSQQTHLTLTLLHYAKTVSYHLDIEPDS